MSNYANPKSITETNWQLYKNILVRLHKEFYVTFKVTTGSDFLFYLEKKMNHNKCKLFIDKKIAIRN